MSDNTLNGSTAKCAQCELTGHSGIPKALKRLTVTSIEEDGGQLSM